MASPIPSERDTPARGVAPALDDEAAVAEEQARVKEEKARAVRIQNAGRQRNKRHQRRALAKAGDPDAIAWIEHTKQQTRRNNLQEWAWQKVVKAATEADDQSILDEFRRQRQLRKDSPRVHEPKFRFGKQGPGSTNQGSSNVQRGHDSGYRYVNFLEANYPKCPSVSAPSHDARYEHGLDKDPQSGDGSVLAVTIRESSSPQIIQISIRHSSHNTMEDRIILSTASSAREDIPIAFRQAVAHIEKARETVVRPMARAQQMPQGPQRMTTRWC